MTTPATPSEFLPKLFGLRATLKKAKSSMFVFEKQGTFFCYREVTGARNQLVLKSSNIDDFVRRVEKTL